MPLDPRITLTLGPASSDRAVMAALLHYASRFRLNASHMTPEDLLGWLGTLSALFAGESKTIPVVVDLQGAKMRIGRYPEVARLPEEVTVLFAPDSSDPAVIPVPSRRLYTRVKTGERLTLNDRRIEIEVTRAGNGSFEAVVLRNGPLSSFKGINRPQHPLPCDAVTEGDRLMIEAAGRFPFTVFAFSFVHDGREATLLRPLTDRSLIAKVERPEAMAHLGKIDKDFDELWFCRGDMGAQAGLKRLGGLQEEMAAETGRLSSPVVLAGQVLHHMTLSPEPTRVEVVGLYRAARDGFSGVVLSDETAVGRYPVEAARTAFELFQEG